MINLKEIDKSVRDYLRSELIGSYGIEDEMQIVATAESPPLEYPFIVCVLTDFPRDYQSTDSIENKFQFNIGIFDEWVNSRELFEKNCELVDVVIDILEDDFEVDSEFYDSLVTNVEFSTIQVKGQQSNMDEGITQITYVAKKLNNI